MELSSRFTKFTEQAQATDAEQVAVMLTRWQHGGKAVELDGSLAAGDRQLRETRLQVEAHGFDYHGHYGPLQLLQLARCCTPPPPPGSLGAQRLQNRRRSQVSMPQSVGPAVKMCCRARPCPRNVAFRQTNPLPGQPGAPSLQALCLLTATGTRTHRR
jgi:hypothetical protein